MYMYFACILFCIYFWKTKLVRIAVLFVIRADSQRSLYLCNLFKNLP